MGGNFKQNPDALSEYITFLETNIADIKAVIEEAGNQDYNRYKNKMLKSLYKPKKIGKKIDDVIVYTNKNKPNKKTDMTF